MEGDPGFRKHRSGLKRLLRDVEALLARTGEALDEAGAAPPSVASLRRLDQLRARLAASVQDYVDQHAAFLDYIREQAAKIEAARRTEAMSEQRSKPARNEARIQELSEELTRDLRLERVDSAIKEILDFLGDADFFAANASTGRKRRLRSLQNAIEKALEK